MRLCHYYIFFYLIFYSFVSFAQPFFQAYSIEQGLPSYSILSITQDKTGFMWFGTSQGISRYDGLRFKTYSTTGTDTSQLANNHILSMLSDSEGTLWVGTTAGLSIYNSQKDRFERINFLGPISVFCIYQDKKKRLWVGSSSGLYAIKNKQLIKYHSGNSNLSVRSIFQDSKNNFWVGTQTGLMQLIDGDPKLIPCPFINLDKNNKTITAITEDEFNNLWIGTQNGGALIYNYIDHSLKELKSNSVDRSTLVNNNIRCITTDINKNIWIGTQEGISIVNPVKKSIENLAHSSGDKNSLSQNSVYSIFQDATGSVWVGTYFGGVNLSYAYNTAFSVIQNSDEANSLSNNVISSIKEDAKQNLWIGTEGGGINYFSPDANTFKVYKHLANNPTSLGSNLVKVIFIDRAGYIWSGTHGGGLNVFDASKNGFKNYTIDSSNKSNSEVSSIIEDQSGKLWVASNIGVNIYYKQGTNLVSESFRSFPVNNATRFLYCDKYNNVWIAQESGISYTAKNTTKIIDNKLSVNCFEEDQQQNILWLGTNGRGLFSYNYKKGSLQSVNNKFLESLNILGIVQDDDKNLWLSSDKGLVRYYPTHNNYQLYTQADGLPGNGFNYNSFLKSKTGLLYFGGFSGITYFNPKNIYINKYTPPIAFTGLKLFDKNLEAGGSDNVLASNISTVPELSFAYNQNVITIEFALLSFIKSEKNKYAYKLDGFDKQWNETEKGDVTYTNLPAGKYIFLVKGTNNDGVWSKTIRLNVHIRPPFWFTWWAYCIYIIVVAIIIFFILRFFFLRALIKKEEELHQAKLDFFTNASHEIRTHLTLIMAPLERLLSENKNNSFVQQQLSRIKGNTNRLLNLVSELMDFRKAETNHLSLSIKKQNLVPFLQNIYESFRESSQSKNISTSFSHDSDLIQVAFDEVQLEKVFFNLLANAIKFTSEGGRIALHAGVQKNNAFVTVTDNGRGIAPQYLDKLFTNFFQVADHGLQNTGYGIGLALSKNIVELHHGTISVESFPAEMNTEGRTVFTVKLPVSKYNKEDVIINSSQDSSQTSVIADAQPPIPTVVAPNHSFAQTILIVEDNDELREIIAEALSGTYNILTSHNGLHGLGVATSEIPDIIISDVMMPEMDGYTLCKKLKTDERTSHIPIILLTAKSAQSEHISGLEHGSDLYLTKPFSTKILLLSIQNLVLGMNRLRQKISHELNVLSNAPVENVNTAPFPNQLDNEFINKVILLVAEYMDDPQFGVDLLAKKVAMSVPVLYKKMKALTNLSVNEFIKTQRFKKAADLLSAKTMNVTEVSYAVGYDDRKYFSREFKKYFGVLPSEYANEAVDSKSL